MNKDGTGFITKVLNRKNHISRKTPKIKGTGFKGERLEQVIAANIDQLFIISSTAEPPFNNKTIDRFLVAAESSHIPVTIIINKSDLIEIDSIIPWIEMYQNSGYSVHLTSVIRNEGLDEIKAKLENKISLVWGQSGVGKSSLLNEIYPSLNLATAPVSTFNERGKHTTVTSIMFNVDENTFVIDTPGVREIDPYGILKEDLGHYFREFESYINNCRFNTCTHHHEPGCSIIEAVNNNEISYERYDSYLRILDTIEDEINY